MAPAVAIDLSEPDRTLILVRYDIEFRKSKGSVRQGVVEKIVKELAAQSESPLSDSDIKSLAKVCQLIQAFNPEISPNSEDPCLVWKPQDCSA